MTASAAWSSRTRQGSDAVHQALRLVTLKYDEDRIRLLRRPPIDVGYAAGDLDLTGEPHVSVWPCEPLHAVRDTVVAASTTAPGYIHRIRRDPRCLWAALSPRVEEACEFRSADEAETWLAEHIEGDDEYRLVWRSVALAEQDREEALYNGEMLG